jgi:hypothetical protein
MSRWFCVFLLAWTPATTWAQQSNGSGPPCHGQVKNANFDFTFTSTYQNNQIENMVYNAHNRSLIVNWPAGCIDSSFRPIPPRDGNSNSYTCVSAHIDNAASLAYGLNPTQQHAPAYVDPPQQQTPEVLTSEIRIAGQPAPTMLQVVSTYLPARGLLVLSVVRNSDFDFAIESIAQTNAALKDSDWKTPYPFRSIAGISDLTKRGNWPERGVKADFLRFQVLRPPVLRAAASAVVPKSSRVTASPCLVIISHNQELVGMGIVSLHSQSEVLARLH